MKHNVFEFQSPISGSQTGFWKFVLQNRIHVSIPYKRVTNLCIDNTYE